MTHISRREWGARPAEAHYLLDREDVRGIALHWPGMAKPLRTVAGVSAALRSWQEYHMDVRDWSDIAYQVAVDQLGNRYQLRGLRYRSGANGDTATNLRYGAALLVLAPGERPTLEMVHAVQRVVERHREIFPNSREVVGHGDIRPDPTACPGPIVSDMIRRGRFNPPPRK